MLVLRYFAYVGGALLALLLVCAAVLPKPAPADATIAAAADLPTIRIHSDRKWPERIAFDTSAPMPAAPAATAGVAAATPALAEAAAKTRGVREAFAQASQDQKSVVEAKKLETKPAPRRKYAKPRVAPMWGLPTMMIAQQRQPHFGFFTW